MAAANDRFERYMECIDGVQGWLSNTTAHISHSLLNFQSQSGWNGNVCEIGVHHGRYFLALATSIDEAEKAVAVDLFGRQDENIDQSGQGDRATFEANVARFADPDRVVVIEGNSLRLAPERLIEQGRIQFFSVDGGHTRQVTAHDLWLSEHSLTPVGIVALDDILSFMWTGVLSGYAKYKAEGGRLAPIALVPNKLLLSQSAHVVSYREHLRSAFADCLVRTDAEFLADTADVIGDSERFEIRVVSPQETPDMAAVTRLNEENAWLRAELDQLRRSRRYRIASAVADAVNRLRANREAAPR